MFPLSPNNNNKLHGDLKEKAREKNKPNTITYAV